VTDTERHFVDYVQQRGTDLLRLATLLTGDRRHAEDILQSTLEGVLRRNARRGPPDQLDAYVRSSLVNSAKRRWRRSSRSHETLVEQLPEAATEQEWSDTVVREQLLSALRRLSARQRAVLAFRYFEDRSEADVAHLLGCSVGSVKAHASRGLAKLRNDPVLSRHIDLNVEV
jgi:RNA polymerase sigma-70 factor (sigma-E family)